MGRGSSPLPTGEPAQRSGSTASLQAIGWLCRCEWAPREWSNPEQLRPCCPMSTRHSALQARLWTTLGESTWVVSYPKLVFEPRIKLYPLHHTALSLWPWVMRKDDDGILFNHSWNLPGLTCSFQPAPWGGGRVLIFCQLNHHKIPRNKEPDTTYLLPLFWGSCPVSSSIYPASVHLSLTPWDWRESVSKKLNGT